MVCFKPVFAAAILALWLVGPVQAATDFPATFDLSQTSTATGVRIDGASVGENTGEGVSAGDVNGDGYDDVVIATAGVSPLRAYVVFGRPGGFPATPLKLSDLNGSNGFRITGTKDDRFAWNATAAGDVNGDGYGDILIGSPYLYASVPFQGGGYVLFGRPGGWPASVSVSSLNGSNGFRMEGGLTYDDVGHCIAAAGDFNGDGLDDIIIGSTTIFHNSSTSAGGAYVVYGRAAGFPASFKLDTLNGSNGFRVIGTVMGDRIATSVAGVGDVNGDGLSDVLIGAAYVQPFDRPSAGASYLIYGSRAPFPKSWLVSTLNGSDGARFDGTDYDSSGWSVSGTGDVNGDGVADFAIGAPNAGPGGNSKSGLVYQLFGATGGFAAVNNLADLMDGIHGTRLEGARVNDRVGLALGGGLDVNGDGFADLVIGAQYTNPLGRVAAGSSFVVLGKQGPFSARFALDSLSGGNGFRLDGANANAHNGVGVAMGDVNGDGFGDVISGAWRANAGGKTAAGSTYVFFGRAPRSAVTRGGSAAAQYINGGAFADTLFGVGNDDRLEGRGGADHLFGQAGGDWASYAHAKAAVKASLATPASNSGEAAGDSYNSIEYLEGSRFNDRLIGNNGGNAIAGLGGHDVMTGNGSGDSFVFRRRSDSPAGANRDIITDFNAGTSSSVVDVIDLSAIDAKTGINGNQRFSFIGQSPFGHAKGQLRIAADAAGTLVQADVNGDAVADIEILLQGFTARSSLTSDDFIR